MYTVYTLNNFNKCALFLCHIHFCAAALKYVISKYYSDRGSQNTSEYDKQ